MREWRPISETQVKFRFVWDKENVSVIWPEITSRICLWRLCDRQAKCELTNVPNPMIVHLPLQWWIQDFPEEGAPTPRGGANIRFCHIFPKTAWNWKNLGPGGRIPCTPLRSATASPKKEKLYINFHILLLEIKFLNEFENIQCYAALHMAHLRDTGVICTLLEIPSIELLCNGHPNWGFPIHFN